MGKETRNWEHITLAALLGLALALVTVGTPGEAKAQQGSIASSMHVELDHVWVSRDSGQYYVDYAVDSNHWRRVRKRSLKLYVGLYLPDGDGHDFRYALRLSERKGHVRFPATLKYNRGWRVGVGVVAVARGQSYPTGAGYVCASPQVVDVHHYRRGFGGPHFRFGLGYHRALHRYRWYGPKFGFHIVIGSSTRHARKHRRSYRHKKRTHRTNKVIIHRRAPRVIVVPSHRGRHHHKRNVHRHKRHHRVDARHHGRRIRIHKRHDRRVGPRISDRHWKVRHRSRHKSKAHRRKQRHDRRRHHQRTRKHHRRDHDDARKHRDRRRRHDGARERHKHRDRGDRHKSRQRKSKGVRGNPG